MKTSFKKHSGLTLIEILVVIALLVILAGLLLPMLAKTNNRSPRIYCLNNLKQIGLSYHLYAGDNGDRYPMNISTNDQPVINEATPVYQYFKLIANELGTPKMAICPDDNKRKVANTFTNFGNGNISYFIGLDAHETLPQSMLSGDRNITNGFSPRNGILDLTTNQMVGFTDEIHLKQGNIALGDGSVQQVSSARLRSEILPHTGFITNRIKLP